MEIEMQLKQSKLFIATLALISMPLIANASLDLYNYTNEDSTVRVTSGSIKPCSSDLGVYTPKASPNGEPGNKFVKDSEISGLCITSKDKTCTADIYNSNNCTGQVVGQASLSLNSKSVTSIVVTDSRYSFEVEGNGTVLKVRYAK